MLIRSEFYYQYRFETTVRLTSEKILEIFITLFQKELGDKKSAGVEQVRLLLPLGKKHAEVITCEPHSLAEKSHKFDSAEKKHVSYK